MPPYKFAELERLIADKRAAGIDDSVQRQVDDIVRESGDESTRPLVEAVCAVAPLYLEWLADELGQP